MTSAAGWVSTKTIRRPRPASLAWTEGHGTGGPAEYEYSYTVSDSGPSYSTTLTLEPSGAAWLPSEQFYDSLGQPVETQAENANGNTVVTDTDYNTDGWTVKTSGPYYISGAPTTAWSKLMTTRCRTRPPTSTTAPAG